MLAGYEHFLGLARSLQWNEAALDLRADAAAWPALEAPLRRRIAVLVAGFYVGEAAVADHLEPFAATAEPVPRAAFNAQAADEQRHARFFDRVARDVLAAPGSSPEDRRAALRSLLAPSFIELFERRLPTVARELARGAGSLTEAVGLYHMVLEGAVFTAGQLALLRSLEAGDPLPGLRAGVELVLRDERWHVGFGTRCLLDVRPDAGTLARLRDEGSRAVAAWGRVVPADVRARVLRIISSRLAVIGLGDRGTAAGALVRVI